VVTSIIAYEGDGAWREYEGGYEDWKIQKKRTEAYQLAQANAPIPKQEVKESKQEAKQDNKQETKQDNKQTTKSKVQKLNGKERQELEAIPGQIESLENEQADISVKLADPDLYKSQPDKLTGYQNRLREIEEQLITLMARWEDLLARSES
jgi:ATP-binding cassette subfamily F protein uup